MTDEPLKYLTLGIDPGQQSGWAVALGDDVLVSGMTESAAARHDTVLTVEKLVASYGLPIVVVTEQWGAGGWQSHKTLLGLGKAYGQWTDHVELILGVREKQYVRVTPQEWRHHFFDHAEIVAAGKEGIKRLACTFASVEDHNQAEAVCLALFGQQSEKGLDAAEKAIRAAGRAAKRRG